MPLRRPADRRVARHVCNSVRRERAKTDPHAETRGGKRSFASRVTSTDDDDVEAIRHRGMMLLSHAEAREDVREQIFRRAASGNLFERVPRVLKIGQDKFF